MSILEKIFAYKRTEVARQKRLRPMETVQRAAEQATPALDFVAALRAAATANAPALIAEVKRASPSRGLLVSDFDPLRLAQIYRQNGAAAISVLTDERYFQGRLETLQQIAAQFTIAPPRLPLLRKDFVCDPYQLYEARAAGADAALLIVACLKPAELCALHALAIQLGMAPLVEVHTLEELRVALDCDPILVGINNRNLHDFTVDLETSLRLRPHLPAGVCVVAESGIHTHADAARMGKAGVNAILVGEALVTAQDVAAKVRDLAGRVKVVGLSKE